MDKQLWAMAAGSLYLVGYAYYGVSIVEAEWRDVGEALIMLLVAMMIGVFIGLNDKGEE